MANIPIQRTIRLDREHAVQAVRAWNDNYSPGQPVRYWPAGVGAGEPVTTTTRYTAQVAAGQTAVIWLTGIPSQVLLDHVEPVRQTETAGTGGELAAVPGCLRELRSSGVTGLAASRPR